MMDRVMTYDEYLRDVKKGIVTDLGNCPVTPLLLMLQGKWKTQILYELCIHDTVRFGTLKKELPGITNTMLTNSLRELERARARHSEREARAGEPVSHFVYKLADRRADVREVAAVSAENYSVVFVEDDDLRRSRAYVKSSVKKLHCIIPPDEKLRRPSLHSGRRPDAGAPVASAAARSCRLPEFICRKENL